MSSNGGYTIAEGKLNGLNDLRIFHCAITDLRFFLPISFFYSLLSALLTVVRAYQHHKVHECLHAWNLGILLFRMNRKMVQSRAFGWTHFLFALWYQKKKNNPTFCDHILPFHNVNSKWHWKFDKNTMIHKLARFLKIMKKISSEPLMWIKIGCVFIKITNSVNVKHKSYS